MMGPPYLTCSITIAPVGSISRSLFSPVALRRARVGVKGEERDGQVDPILAGDVLGASDQGCLVRGRPKACHLGPDDHLGACLGLAHGLAEIGLPMGLHIEQFAHLPATFDLAVIPATRTVSSVSLVGARFRRREPKMNTTARTAPKAASPRRISPPRLRFSQAQLATEANHPIRKVIPIMPVTEASCMSGRFPYWVKPVAPQVPTGLVWMFTNSRVVAASG